MVTCLVSNSLVSGTYRPSSCSNVFFVQVTTINLDSIDNTLNYRTDVLQPAEDQCSSLSFTVSKDGDNVQYYLRDGEYSVGTATPSSYPLRVEENRVQVDPYVPPKPGAEFLLKPALNQFKPGESFGTEIIDPNLGYRFSRTETDSNFSYLLPRLPGAIESDARVLEPNQGTELGGNRILELEGGSELTGARVLELEGGLELAGTRVLELEGGSELAYTIEGEEGQFIYKIEVIDKVNI